MDSLTRTSACAGLFRKKTFWVPSWRGCLLMLFLVAGTATLAVRNVHPFLALSDPRPAELLVVEGWAPDYVFAEAIAEFRRGSYRQVLVTGGPVDAGAPLTQHKTYAALGASILIAMGLESSKVEAVPAPSARQDRTFASALALAKWLGNHPSKTPGLNLVSLGAHSRRSRLLFEQALGSGLGVGILSVQDQRYDPAHWWRSSAGFRLVLDEVFAYAYTKLLFNPNRG